MTRLIQFLIVLVFVSVEFAVFTYPLWLPKFRKKVAEKKKKKYHPYVGSDGCLHLIPIEKISSPDGREEGEYIEIEEEELK